MSYDGSSLATPLVVAKRPKWRRVMMGCRACWEEGVTLIRDNLGLGGALWFARSWLATTISYLNDSQNAEDYSQKDSSIYSAIDWGVIVLVFTSTLVSIIENKHWLCWKHRGQARVARGQKMINESFGICAAAWAGGEQILRISDRDFSSLNKAEFHTFEISCIVGSLLLFWFQYKKKDETSNKTITVILDAICTIIGRTLGVGGAVWAYYNISSAKSFHR